MKGIIGACLIALLATVASAANKTTDLVTSLPLCAPLPSAWYSGYLGITATK